MARKTRWPPNVHVKQGVVRVNAIYEIVRHDDVIVYEGDLRAKYAEVFGYSSSSDAPGQVRMELVANEHTLHKEKSKGPTTITFQLPAPHPDYHDYWSPVSSLSRYTLSVIFYRHRK